MFECTYHIIIMIIVFVVLFQGIYLQKKNIEVFKDKLKDINILRNRQPKM